MLGPQARQLIQHALRQMDAVGPSRACQAGVRADEEQLAPPPGERPQLERRRQSVRRSERAVNDRPAARKPDGYGQGVGHAPGVRY